LHHELSSYDTVIAALESPQLKMPAPTPLPKYIYKIVPNDPRPLKDGLPISDLDGKDGFIHMSTAEQTPKTLGRFFKDANVVYLLKVPYAKVEGKIKWEEAGAGTFPHIYDDDISKSIDDGNVDAVLELKRDDGEDWVNVATKAIAEAS
jgi:uncharacterized protein (DUF952 family)